MMKGKINNATANGGRNSAVARASRRLNLAIHRIQFSIGHNTAVDQPAQTGLVGVARNDVYVQMEDFLAGHLARRGQYVESVRGQPVHEQPRDSIYRRSDLGQCTWSGDHVGHMPLRHYQGMSWMPGADIEKRHGPVVFIDPSSGQLSGNDLAEEAIGINGLRLRRLKGRHVMMFSSSWPAAKRPSWAAISRSARGKKAVLAPPT
jgi:hypothetical protein